MESHDHNFKNVFLDFPKEALGWLAPKAFEVFGAFTGLEFVRQEPKKRKLKDSHLALDMPILFRFEEGQVLLWLVEFEESKSRFSLLGHYTVGFPSFTSMQYAWSSAIAIIFNMLIHLIHLFVFHDQLQINVSNNQISGNNLIQ